MEAGGHRKKAVKIPTTEKILEVGEDSGDQCAAWREVLGDNQRPWLLTPEAGTCQLWHSITGQGFLPLLPWPAATSLWGGTSRPGERSAGGEGMSKRVRKSSRVKALISLVLK